MEGNIIIDTHASIGEHGRYMPGLPGDVVSGIKSSLKALICIDALTSKIILRRERDTTRHREVEGPETINMQRMINVSALSAITQEYNVPLFVLFNEEDKQDESVRIFKKYVDYIFNEDRMKRHF
jgi:adenylate kinase